MTTEKDFVLALEKRDECKGILCGIVNSANGSGIEETFSDNYECSKARGVETEGSIWVRAKVFVPTIVPLVLSSIQGTEERALTLEARGFSVETPSTHLYDIEARPIDKVVTIVIFSVFLLIILGEYYYGLYRT